MSQTIALVDDDRNLLTSISIALEREGFKVHTYIDGESAFNGLVRNPPDLAIVDIKMPRMDGEELLTKIRKKMSIPIIFLTSKDEEVDELLGLKSGTNKGMGGSPCIFDKSKNIYGHVGLIGDQVPVAAGFSLVKKKTTVCLKSS